MTSYHFILNPNQPFNKDALFHLQTCLASAGIFLDLSWKDDMPWMSIYLPEDLIEKTADKEADPSGVEKAEIKLYFELQNIYL